MNFITIIPFEVIQNIICWVLPIVGIVVFFAILKGIYDSVKQKIQLNKRKAQLFNRF